MTNIAIIYYSGTNNTKYITESLYNKLSMNHKVTIYSVFDNQVDFAIFDLIIICYPIYAFNCPKVLENYICKSNIKNKNYLIIKNSGEGLHMNDSSSYKIYRILKKRKCKLINECHLLMPYYIIFKHDIRMVKQMLIYNNLYLDYIVLHLFDPNTIKIKYKHIRTLGFLQRFGALINSFFYHTNKQCNQCKKCVNICPVHNINKTNKKITFSHHCLMCMRCVANCPNNAIIPGFLDKWKVNGSYDLQSIINDDSIEMNYLSVCSRRFYNVYYKYYQELDNLFNSIS